MGGYTSKCEKKSKSLHPNGHISQSHASFPHNNCISQALPHLYCMVILASPMLPFLIIIVFPKHSHIFAWPYWTVPCFLSSSLFYFPSPSTSLHGHIGQSHASFSSHNCISQALPHLYCMFILASPMLPFLLIIVFPKPSHIFTACSYWSVPCFLSSS